MGLFECYVCDGPNNICKDNELGTLQACKSDEEYCIKELSGSLSLSEAAVLSFECSGDASNRELVARKCGNEFDRYLACGSGSEVNLGIAATGDVRCCSNRYQQLTFQANSASFILFREEDGTGCNDTVIISSSMTTVLTLVIVIFIMSGRSSS